MESIPSEINRYRILEEVGRGGMAVVYRAIDQSLDREVAVKVLHPHLSKDPESRARFQREARAVARLHHPHIIEIYDFSETAEGLSYIVTEFIHGQTLRAFLEERQAFFPEIAALLCVPICEAVAHAHGLQIIHRDLKPENIMVDRQGTLKLMDFGIAKVLDAHQQMTLTGSILGSPAHMAPELLEGRELDFRSDLFSIGTILYWCATGHFPFAGKNPHQIMKHIMEGTYPDPQQQNPVVGAALARIIKKTLETDPANRVQSASALQTELVAALSELELNEVEAELKFFFAQPEEYLRGLRQKLSAHLLQRGKQLLKARKPRPALEALDRLLALSPGHPEAVLLVDGLQRRARWRKILWRSGAVIAAILALGGLAWWSLTRPPGPIEPADAGLLAPLADAGVAASAADARSAADEVAVANPLPAPDAGPAPVVKVAVVPNHNPPRAARIPVAFYIDPYFDQIQIDNQILARNDRSTNYGQQFQGELAPGKHRVVISQKACQSAEFTIDVPAEADPDRPVEIRKQLRFRPAALIVDTDLAEAEVWLDDKFNGTAGATRASPIPITIEGRQGKREIALRLVDPRGGEIRRVLTVVAGEQKVVAARKADFPAAGPDGGSP